MNTIASSIFKMTLTPLVYSLFIKEIKGGENFSRSGNYILASNHLSHLDWIIEGFVCTPRKFTYIGQIDKMTGFKKWCRDLAYGLVGVIPMDRSDGESKKRAVDTAIKMLKEGYCLIIYPEGTRSRDGRLQRFRPGVGKLHLETGVPVLPVAFKGTYELMPPGGKLKIKKGIAIAFGKPMDFPEEREAAKNLDKNSDGYRDICIEIAKKVEDEVRKLIENQTHS